MDILVHIVAVLLSLLLAAVKNLHYTPNTVSDFELERNVARGDIQAVAEHQRRALLPTFLALRHVKELLLNVLIATMLLLAYPSVFGALFVIVHLLLAHILAMQGWLEPLVGRIQHRFELKAQPHVAKLAPYLKVIAPKPHSVSAAHISSRDELRHLIQNDHHILQAAEKTALLAAFDFGQKTVGDVMIPAKHIATVDISETVGPVLLDRLHKVGHDIFVVVKKDLDDVRGLLYMRDLIPLDPELQQVKDALRPTVHYLPRTAGLQDVLAASLMTGRQLFLAVNEHGKVSGLVTLADALAHVTGEQLSKDIKLATDPKQLA